MEVEQGLLELSKRASVLIACESEGALKESEGALKERERERD